MGFFKNLFKLASVVGLAAASPVESPAQGDWTLQKRGGGGTCTDGQWGTPAVAGPAGGAAFCETGWNANYIPITNLTVWFESFSINGLQATYADGTLSDVIGTTTSEVGTIGVNYVTGDTWSGFFMYYAEGSYLNAFQLFTSGGASLYAGETPYYLGMYGVPQTSQAVGTGILYGLQGTADSGGISSLSGLFLQTPISSIQITDFSFPEGPSGDQDISPVSLANAHYYNAQTDSDSTWSFTNSDAIQTTDTFASATMESYGQTQSYTLSLMIPMIGIGGSTTQSFTWTTAYTQTTTTAIAKTVTVQWAQSGTLTPGTGVDAQALVGQGQGTFPYTSQVTINLNNGDSFTYPEKGELTINDVSDAIVTVTSDNNPE